MGKETAAEKTKTAQMSNLVKDIPMREALRILVLSFISFWHFGIRMSFMASIWWHFLDPSNLSMDLAAVGTLFAITVLVPVFLEVPILHSLLLRFWWVVIGVVPALLVAFTTIDNTRLRTTLLALSCTMGYAGNAAALAAPAGSPLSRAWPWAAALGVLLMHVMKLAWGSVNPTMDKHYTDPAYAYLGFKLVSCLLVLLGSVWLGREGATDAVDPPKEDDAVDVEAPTGMLAFMCPDRSSWLWVALGPVLACTTTLDVAWMSNPAAMAKHVGRAPFPAAVAVTLVFAVGVLCSYFLARRGVALPIFAAVTLFVGSLLLGGNAECRGFGQCDAGFVSFAGAVLLALVQPSLIMILSIQVSRLAREGRAKCCGVRGNVGRLFAFSGFFVFVHVFLYLAAITYNGVPSFGGRIGQWLWLVTWPAVAGLLTLVALHFKDRSFDKVFTATPEAVALDAPIAPDQDARFEAKVGPAPKAALCLLLCVGLLFMIAIGSRASRAVVTIKPQSATALKVMAFNNMQGYDTDGFWNGECSVDLIRAAAPDHVAMPEGEAMRAYTGNRDAVDYVATTLQMYVDHGPPGWAGGVGVGVLSTRPFEESSWEAMPKEETRMNRFLVRSLYKLNGVAVTVLSIHAEWFGDPSVQVSFIAKTAKEIGGPIVVTGDFNLEPNGANNNAVNATGLQVMIDAGFASATPLTCLGDKPKDHLCRSSFPNTVIDSGCRGLAECDGYQLDYIFYTPRWLSVVPGSVEVIEGKIGETTWCSDHQPLVATLELTAEGRSLPMPLSGANGSF